jgi:hypothetical protein
VLAFQHSSLLETFAEWTEDELTSPYQVLIQTDFQYLRPLCIHEPGGELMILNLECSLYIAIEFLGIVQLVYGNK